MKSERIKLTSPEAFMNAFNRSGYLHENEEKELIVKQNIPKSIVKG
ncbi:MAG: hypothetical protein ACFE9L_10865 [Candidatus Hodarchaeota archaeon]